MSRAEHWAADAGSDGVCRLDIPPDAERERRFEVSCRFVVAHPGSGRARHGMSVSVDGALEWSREIDTAEGPSDSLDLQFSRSVGVGRPLRILATTSVERSQRLRLTVSAEET